MVIMKIHSSKVLILTAEGMVEDILRFPMTEFTEGVPEAVKHAIFLCVSKLYEVVILQRLMI